MRLRIEGMSCQACATRIEKVLGKKDAVLAASVNFAGEEAQVRFDAALAGETMGIPLVMRWNCERIFRGDTVMQWQ